MGLRHMTVVDENNRVIGVITRKDLMGFNLEGKLLSKIRQTQSSEDVHVRLDDWSLSVDRGVLFIEKCMM